MKKMLLSVIITLSSFVVFANNNADKPAKSTTAKLTEMVANADEDDWATYSKAAELAINWNADLELAKDWLDMSMHIDENSTNLEVLGDYYVRLGDSEKAFNTYMKALEDDISNLDQDSRDRIQRKVLVYAEYK